ncbi:MAG: lipoyl(octanoyl) transferase LipB [Pseudomonadota bacterium]
MAAPDTSSFSTPQPADRVARPVAWQVSDRAVGYEAATAFMDARATAIAAGTDAECVWLLEHPPLYTGGTSAKAADLLAPDQFPVFQTGRGGQFTYHGPGQRVGYAMLDLNARGRDVRAYVHKLEDWLIAALDAFNVRGERRADRVGVWVRRPDLGREDKIAAIGVRVRRWVTLHGISLNVDPDLAHFSGIVPCGVDPAAHGVTSLIDLGLPVTMADVDVALRAAFEDVFGPTRDAPTDPESEASSGDQ